MGAICSCFSGDTYKVEIHSPPSIITIDTPQKTESPISPPISPPQVISSEPIEIEKVEEKKEVPKLNRLDSESIDYDAAFLQLKKPERPPPPIPIVKESSKQQLLQHDTEEVQEDNPFNNVENSLQNNESFEQDEHQLDIYQQQDEDQQQDEYQQQDNCWEEDLKNEVDHEDLDLMIISEDTLYSKPTNQESNKKDEVEQHALFQLPVAPGIKIEKYKSLSHSNTKPKRRPKIPWQNDESINKNDNTIPSTRKSEPPIPPPRRPRSDPLPQRPPLIEENSEESYKRQMEEAERMERENIIREEEEKRKKEEEERKRKEEEERKRKEEEERKRKEEEERKRKEEEERKRKEEEERKRNEEEERKRLEETKRLEEEQRIKEEERKEEEERRKRELEAEEMRIMNERKQRQQMEEEKKLEKEKQKNVEEEIDIEDTQNKITQNIPNEPPKEDSKTESKSSDSNEQKSKSHELNRNDSSDGILVSKTKSSLIAERTRKFEALAKANKQSNPKKSSWQNELEQLRKSKKISEKKANFDKIFDSNTPIANKEVVNNAEEMKYLMDMKAVRRKEFEIMKM